MTVADRPESGNKPQDGRQPPSGDGAINGDLRKSRAPHNPPQSPNRNARAPSLRFGPKHSRCARKTVLTNSRLPNTALSLKYRTRQRNNCERLNRPPSRNTRSTSSGSIPERIGRPFSSTPSASPRSYSIIRYVSRAAFQPTGDPAAVYSRDHRSLFGQYAWQNLL